jgi:8-oxo-dGTP pyrophosphatase MutT (NUDIX family)
VHIHENHGKNHDNHHNNKNITQLYNFALVICKHPITGKYLLCQEFANQGFWCPGGAVDPGETLSIAAVRETLEEAGIEVELKGILGIEYNPCGTHWRNNNNLVRMRVIFYAEPSPLKGMQQLPKSSPDFESVGACWCSYEEIQTMIKLRGGEPQKWSR